MKKLLIIGAISFIIAIGGSVLLRTFIFGNLMMVSKIPINYVSVKETKVEISGQLQDSALAYKSFRYRIDGEAIYVKVYNVVVSPIHKYGTIQISIDGSFSNINAIYLEDLDNKRIIWER